MKWWHAVVLMLLASLAGSIVREIRHERAASGTEAQRATTTQIGVVHDGPAPKADARAPVHTPPPISRTD